MSNEQKYLEDISEIRKVMDRSTRFLSLTGWSGIMAGIYALLGAYIAHAYLLPDKVVELSVLAIAVMILAIGTAVLFAYRKSTQKGLPFRSSAAKRLVSELFIPVGAGGILAIIFYQKELFEYILPVTLIFYGLGLMNAAKYSLHELRQLGILQLLLGLIAAYFVSHGLIFWAIGFGLLHIIYGIAMHLKYER